MKQLRTVYVKNHKVGSGSRVTLKHVLEGGEPTFFHINFLAIAFLDSPTTNK